MHYDYYKIVETGIGVYICIYIYIYICRTCYHPSLVALLCYGLDVMDCKVKPSFPEGFQCTQRAPQGEHTKGTFLKSHFWAYPL